MGRQLEVIIVLHENHFPCLEEQVEGTIEQKLQLHLKI